MRHDTTPVVIHRKTSNFERPSVKADTRRSSLVAILLGGLVVDFLGTRVIGGVVATVFAALLSSRGHTDAEIQLSFFSVPFLLLINAIGFSTTIAGGFVAASWVKRNHLIHAGASGALSLLIGLPIYILPETGASPWWDIVAVAFAIPAALVGGKLALNRAA